METAAPIARALHLRVRTAPGLLECDFGDWTGARLSALRRRREWRAVQLAPSTFRFPRGESFAEMQTRAWEAVLDLGAEHRGETIVAVSHADPIKAVVATALGVPLDLFQRAVVGDVLGERGRGRGAGRRSCSASTRSATSPSWWRHDPPARAPRPRHGRDDRRRRPAPVLGAGARGPAARRREGREGPDRDPRVMARPGGPLDDAAPRPRGRRRARARVRDRPRRRARSPCRSTRRPRPSRSRSSRPRRTGTRWSSRSARSRRRRSRSAPCSSSRRADHPAPCAGCRSTRAVTTARGRTATTPRSGEPARRRAHPGGPRRGRPRDPWPDPGLVERDAARDGAARRRRGARRLQARARRATAVGLPARPVATRGRRLRARRAARDGLRAAHDRARRGLRAGLDPAVGARGGRGALPHLARRPLARTLVPVPGCLRRRREQHGPQVRPRALGGGPVLGDRQRPVLPRRRQAAHGRLGVRR